MSRKAFSKLGLLVLALFSVLGGYLVGGVVRAEDKTLSNGDFETRNLMGWTTFTTANGTLGGGFPKVVLFDINGDGVATYSAQFRVGQKFNSDTSYEGGGIYQEVHLAAGDYVISADIAADDDGTYYGNAEAGLFGLLVDGVVVASHNFGAIAGGATEYSLPASLPINSAGIHEIRLRITRPASEPPYDLTQFIDNVVVSGGALDPNAVDPAAAGCDQPFSGGGQREDVDKLLTYCSLMSKTTNVQNGSTYVKIYYGADIVPGTFTATLNKQPISESFTPAQSGNESIHISLSSGRNVLALSVTDGAGATDRDRLTFVVP